MSEQKSSVLLATSGMARLMGVTPQTIRNWIRRGILKPKKVSNGTNVFCAFDAQRAKAYRQSLGGRPGRPAGKRNVKKVVLNQQVK